MNKKNYLCINKKTGVSMDNCNNDDNTYVLKSDYLSPDNNYVCKNNNKIYYTKIDCNTNYGTYLKKDPVVIHEDNKYNKIMEDRDMSRVLVMFLFMILITSYIIHNYVWGNTYFFEIIAITLLIFLIILTFCPFNICTLEPSSNNFRKNPISYIYSRICIFLSIFKINVC